MPDAFLDSSALIGLSFRHAAERANCLAAIPRDGASACSRYVIYEVARGYLRSLIALHNYSFEFTSFADLHQAAHSGQQRFKPYAMHTWLGAFDDYFATLESEDGDFAQTLRLEELRAKLRVWIRRGWRRMLNNFNHINDIGCREDLPAPSPRADQRLDQRLPDAECGKPAACRLQTFIQSRMPLVEAVTTGLEGLPAKQRDKETAKRIEALRHLLGKAIGDPFNGSQCHRSSDALICIEAPQGNVVITKNRRHFEPILRILGKRIAVTQSSRTTRQPTSPK